MVGLESNSLSRQEALSTLAWLVDAGIDTAMDDRPRDWLAPREAMEAVVEEPARRSQVPAANALPATSDAAMAHPEIDGATSIEALRRAIEAIRPQPIFADGDPSSGVMIVGEGPSPDDDRTGAPFSGPSGRLLDRMLAAIGRDRSSCYLSNLIMWRAPGGRPASDEDIALGRAILRRHIALAAPRALLVMGGMPAQALLDTETGITRLRGRWLDLELDGVTVPALPTFNPAYLLRVPKQKSLAWVDLLAFKTRIDA